MTSGGPARALQYYRTEAPEAVRDQVEMFKTLPLTDQMELLIYMLLYTNNQLAKISEGVGVPLRNIGDEPLDS